MILDFNSFASMVKALPTDNACREYLELQRWGGVPVCPHCGVIDVNHYKLNVKGEFKGLYKCKSCKHRFTVLLGTIFEGSPIPLQKWFIATYMFSAHKKGVSSHQLGRDLNVTQATAWFMLHRLRVAFTENNDSPLGGDGVVVEADNTIVGGKVKNMSNSKRRDIKDGKRGINDNKTTVAGYIERSNKIRFDVMDSTESDKGLLAKHVDTGSVLMTDSATTYTTIGKEYAHHGIVDHSKSEYVKDKIYHTNTLEGAFSLFDRMIIGIYHSVTPKHLQAYCNETAFRYNSRKITDKMRFDMALKCTDGAKLSYATLIAR
jgi:transposase-like protein